MSTYTRAATLVAAGTLALTGCGGSGSGGAESGFTEKSADEIKKIAIADMKSLTSLSMAGDITNDGEKLGLDLTVGQDGQCEGSFSAQGARADIRVVDGTTFLKGDERFWTVSSGDATQGAAMAQLIGDRWVDAGPSASFDELCDLDGLIDSFDEDDDDTKSSKGETKRIDGTEAIGIVGEDDDGNETTGWVATGDKHYLLRLEQVGGDEPGVVSFSGFDEPVDVQAPTGDDVVDLSSLGG